MVRIYNKLIRDRIPEIIKGEGEKPYFRTLTKKEFISEIKKKILEEAQELIRAKDKREIINEIVDIQEIIDVFMSEIGLTRSKLRKLQKRKNKKRGGFKKRLFLISTETRPRA